MDHSKFIIRARAVIAHEGKLLVVKHRPEADYYALPGGHLEPYETPLECCVREIIEELGVTPVIGRLLTVHIFNYKGSDAVEFFFEVKNGEDFLNLEGFERTHAHELSEIRWITPDENINLLPHSVMEQFANGTLLSGDLKYTKG